MNLKNEELLGKSNVKRALMTLSVPAIIGMMVNALYNFVDTLFVAKGVGEIAIGGLALAFPIQMIVMAVGLMIGMGSASVFSRAFGRKDYEKMDDSVNTAIRIDLIGALIFTVLGFIFLDELLLFFGASESNIGYATDYLGVILIGLVPLSLSMVLNNLTRAEGRANIAMISMMIGTGLNIILDPIFIFDFGFGMGVKGAAIATVISQVVAFIYIFIAATSKKSSLKIHFKNWLKIDLKMTKEILVIGMPSFLRNSIGAFLAILIYRLINFYAVGDPGIYISIYGVINRVMSFVFMPAFGLIQGLTPIVGYNFGAKNHQRVREVIIYTTKIMMIYFFVGFLFVEVFATSIFRLFSENGSLEFINYGSEAFRTIAIGFVVVGFQIIIGAVYQAIGYPVRAILSALSRQVLFFIPLAFLFSSLWGLQGVWISFAAADVLSGIISLFLLVYEMRAIQGQIMTHPLKDAPIIEPQEILM